MLGCVADITKMTTEDKNNEPNLNYEDVKDIAGAVIYEVNKKRKEPKESKCGDGWIGVVGDPRKYQSPKPFEIELLPFNNDPYVKDYLPIDMTIKDARRIVDTINQIITYLKAL